MSATIITNPFPGKRTNGREADTAAGPPKRDRTLIDGIRKGDETAFLTLAATYHHTLVRIAECYVDEPEAAEDIVMETWMNALDAIDAIGDRTVKSWLIALLGETALRRAVDRSPDAAPVRTGQSAPRKALATLPRSQRHVVTLRDVAGWTGDEIREVLAISDGEYQWLLHAGRTQVSRALAFAGTATAA
jgi:DNA-directed RNA polymerase specialized sigma24 family protein